MAERGTERGTEILLSAENRGTKACTRGESPPQAKNFGVQKLVLEGKARRRRKFFGLQKLVLEGKTRRRRKFLGYKSWY